MSAQELLHYVFFILNSGLRDDFKTDFFCLMMVMFGLRRTEDAGDSLSYYDLMDALRRVMGTERALWALDTLLDVGYITCGQDGGVVLTTSGLREEEANVMEFNKLVGMVPPNVDRLAVFN